MFHKIKFIMPLAVALLAGALLASPALAQRTGGAISGSGNVSAAPSGGGGGGMSAAPRRRWRRSYKCGSELGRSGRRRLSRRTGKCRARIRPGARRRSYQLRV